MASIIQFIRRPSDFDDALTTVLGEAFDAACRDLPQKDEPTLGRSSPGASCRPPRKASVIQIGSVPSHQLV